jgi:hypothetical protein
MVVGCDWEFDMDVVRPDENLAWLRAVANNDIVFILVEGIETHHCEL